MFRQGIGALGASSVDDPFTSRGASGTFSIVDVAFSRFQDSPKSGRPGSQPAREFASAPLFTSQQFYLGGAKFGRGYDSGLLSGDNGVGAAVELMFDQKVASPYLLGYQLYGFVDGGAVWDVDDDFGTVRSCRSASARGSSSPTIGRPASPWPFR